MSRRVRTGCPYCGVGCGLVAVTEGDRLVGVEGDRLHPVNRGATCRKPLHLPDAVHAPDRARTPLLRPDRAGPWEQSTWRQASATLARRLQETAERHGSESIAFYVSGQLLTEDLYVANKLAKGFLGTNNVDSNSRLCMSSAVAGYTQAYGFDGPPPGYADLDLADCTFLLGSNAAACHPIVWNRIRRRQSEGGFVIVADPRRTPTAEAADLHLPVRPGADLPLLNAMVHVLAREGLIDETFVGRRTEGADAALAAASDWTPERAAGACGVPADLIVAAARRFGEARRAMALWSMGANQSTVGTLKNRALNNLCLLTGNIGRPGTGPLSLTGQPNAMGGREAGTLSTLLPGYRRVADAEARAEMRRLWAIPPDAAGVSAQAGLAATELVDALEDGRIRALWIAGTNPVVSQPESERFAAAIRRAELVVVQDAYHPTETGALADVLLPAAQWPEKEGTMTNSERRVTLVQRALPPPGQALPDWEIFARVARALGHREAFGWSSPAEVFDEFAATTGGRPCDVTGISHARLRRDGPLQWPCPAYGPDGDGHAGTERLYGTRFPTDDGRARLAATPHADPADATDESFPLLLTTGRVAGQWHTMTRTGKSPELLADASEPFLEIHSEDAERAGVRDGDRVAVRSRRGVADARARVSDAVPPGTAFAPMHWGSLHLPPGRRPVNAVTNGALDPDSKQAELKVSAVRVEPAGATRAPHGGGAESVLVVGGGMAGLAVVEGLLEHGVSGAAIALAGAEPHPPYDRVRLAQVFDAGADRAELRLREPEWFASHGVRLHTGARVAAIDLEGRVARLATGRQLGFDQLVFATGSRPSVPPIRGLERSGVFSFRSLGDAEALAAAAEPRAPAVVVGGGLLGLEAARALQMRGMRVTVVHLADRVMEQQLDALAAGVVERRLRELGIDVLLGASTTDVSGNGRAEGVRLADGREFEAAMVVVATGVRPEVELAREAGLEVARGIVVDDELRTSAPGVWAVGECAEHRGNVYGLWGPASAQARVAAAVLAGRPAAFHGATPATTLKVMGVDLFSAGRPAAADGEEELIALDTRAGHYRKLVLSGGNLAGAILVGDLTEAPQLLRHLESGRPAPEELVTHAPRPNGAPGDGGLLCSCNFVTRDEVASAVAAGGLTRVADVARATGATTGCGGCRASVEALLASARDERAEMADARAARAVGR